MKNDEIRNDRLMPLSSMKEYKVAKDNPDVLGWRVVGSDGESLGIVKDLIVDPQLMKARYLSVVADRRFFNTDNDQNLLVPIGAAALDKSGKKVFLSSVDSKSVAHYPVFHSWPIPDDYEYAVRDTFQQAHRDVMPDTTETRTSEFDEAVRQEPSTTRHISPDFYNDETFNEDRFYTSNQEVYRDRAYPSYTADESYTKDELHKEEKRPASVEDSIATIERLEQLRERGSLTEEEFRLLKKRALNL
ncbi:PRC-barrel domain-containing protein [Pontibacter vulgaris]|uniref:PRC-barrel domain-containing protein n=1 Tax=Pontibacter vulgaris TaxID=2905679 RepID=UPI001FA75D8D|nr:PRC-barrel domain-containing protein [Pontibacter vulgaris]